MPDARTMQTLMNATPDAPKVQKLTNSTPDASRVTKKTNSTPDALTKHASGQAHPRRGTHLRKNLIFSRHHGRLHLLLAERCGTQVINGLGNKTYKTYNCILLYITNVLLMKYL
jgi:hypothetical protein